MGTEEKRIMIGVCGGTGSGKTTLARRIYDALGGDALLLNMDCYYKDHKEMPYEERCKLNYDCPSAFDGELLVSHLKALKPASLSFTRPTILPAICAPTKPFTPKAKG